jgi:hypothetical protein
VAHHRLVLDGAAVIEDLFREAMALLRQGTSNSLDPEERVEWTRRRDELLDEIEELLS